MTILHRLVEYPECMCEHMQSSHDDDDLCLMAGCKCTGYTWAGQFYEPDPDLYYEWRREGW